jgi:hypothetical protein
MLDMIQTGADRLRSARARHGQALRLSRRAGADLVREAFILAAPMLGGEALPLPATKGESTNWERVDSGRGVLILDLAVRDREQSGHDETDFETGWQIFARADGTLIETHANHSCGRFDAAWDRRFSVCRPIGYREAVRRYGAEALVEALGKWLIAAAEGHDKASAEEQARASRFKAALAALK